MRRTAFAPMKKLRQSEELFKTVFFGIPDLAGIVDAASGRFLEVNAGCERLLGWRRDEIVGHRAAEVPIWPNREARAPRRVKSRAPARSLIPRMSPAAR